MTWEQRIKQNDIPGARVWGIDEAVNHPQIAHRDLIQTVDGPYGALPLMGPGFRLAHGSAKVDRPPPSVGEHNAEILAAAGYAADEIAAMKTEKII